MKNRILCDLRTKRPLILDGGLGQLVQDKYPEIDIRNGLWASGVAARFPEVIKDIHLMYLRAGCDIISTATYQASLDGYMEAGLATDLCSATDAMSVTLALAVDARVQYLRENPGVAPSQRPLIAAAFGSIGATLGDCSEYTGNFGISLSSNDIYEFHKQRLLMLYECLKGEKLAKQVDIIAIETIPSIQEAVSVIDALRDIKAEGIVLPDTWMSFSARSEECIGSGELICDAVKIANSSPVVSAVGVNCVSVDIVDGLLRRIKQATNKPLVCYPNGQAWQGSQKLWDSGGSRIAPNQFAERALGWVGAGADIVGGCCKTTPEHIKAIYEEIMRMYRG